MSVTTEIDRLESIMLDDDATSEQAAVARQAWQRLKDDEKIARWAQIEARGAELEALSGKLTTIVDAIQANQLTTVIDDLNALGDEVKQRVEGA